MSHDSLGQLPLWEPYEMVVNLADLWRKKRILNPPFEIPNNVVYFSTTAVKVEDNIGIYMNEFLKIFSLLLHVSLYVSWYLTIWVAGQMRFANTC